MRGLSRVAGLALLLASVAVPTPANAAIERVADGEIGDWRGASSRLGGTWQYSQGEFVYQDHLFDDLGAETRSRSQQHGTVGAPAGDYRYPTDEKRYGYNAADLLELRLAADASSIWILARMSTLKARDSTVVAVGLDTDRDQATGGGPWPYGSGLAVPGVDRVITLWGTGGSVTRLPSGVPVKLKDVAADTGNDNNAIEARVPRSTIARGGVVRVWAATGLWDRVSRQWMAVPPGSPTATRPGGGSATVPARAFNVAFRADDEGSFMEEHQAAALAAGDLTPFHADVDLGALQRGLTRPYRIRAGHFYAAIMDQEITIPPHNEGLSYDGIPGRFQGAGGAALDQHFDFYGRHQPYGLYVPSTYGRARALPAALVLHGLGGSHSTYNSQPGFIADMGEGDGTRDQPPLLLITPLARGSSFYSDWGEADTLAALSDVLRRFPVDRDRLYLTGYSMGGYGVYRLASLYPDRFAAAAAWAGYTGEFTGAYLTDPRWVTGDPTGQYDAVARIVRQAISPAGVGGGRQGKAVIGDPVETLENLRHLPLMHLAGTNDEIVPTSGQYAAPRRLAELGYRSRFDLYPGYEHFSFALVDDWKQVRAWIGDQRRETAPREITYKFSDGWTAPGLARRLSLVHGNAWWVRDVSMRTTTTDGLRLASIHATSDAIRARNATPTRAVLPSGTPTPHVEQTVGWTMGRALPASNRLGVDVSGVGKATVDMRGAQLAPCGLSVSVRSDGPAVVRLSGTFPARAHVVGRSGWLGRDRLVLTVRRAGTESVRIECRR